MKSSIKKIHFYLHNMFKTVIVKLWNEHDYFYHSPYGASFVLNFRKDVDRYLFFDSFENETLKLFQCMVGREDVVVDVGANIGIYSVIASKKNSGGGKVIAFEPSDWANSRLLLNIELNGCRNVTVFGNAVSEKRETLQFHMCDDDAYNSIGAKPMHEVKTVKNVEAIALDDFIPSLGISRVDLLKIDTEGADYLVVKGFEKHLRKEDAPVIFCEYNRNIISGYEFQIHELYTFLVSLGFTIYELNGQALKVFDPATSCSNEIICVKPLKEPVLRKAIYETTTSR